MSQDSAGLSNTIHAANSNLEKIFEEDPSSSQDLSDLPELRSVKRLSCFEEICPSNEDIEAA